ncbi:MAG TPA: helix-turn-helix transcriptional regulator [Jatrophihabitantaceae bacterium]
MDETTQGSMNGGWRMPAKTPRAAGDEPPEGSAYVADVLAENIRAYRLLRRREQEDVASRMQLLGHPWRRVTVSEVERGRRNVTVPELVSLVLVLGANIEQLLDPRGPGGKTGPDLRLVKDETTWAKVDPRHVTGLVCSHKVYTGVAWGDERVQPGLHEVVFVDVRPDLTDVGPEGQT